MVDRFIVQCNEERKQYNNLDEAVERVKGLEKLGYRVFIYLKSMGLYEEHLYRIYDSNRKSLYKKIIGGEDR